MKNIKKLEQEIIRHKNLYYQGKPEISDETFDQLELELKKLSPESPVLSMVGSTVKTSNKIKHEKKMLSLEKTYELEKLKSWINEQEIISMFKLDGSACSLVYEDGVLTMAKTRGDGEWGENIIAKAIFVKNIPSRIDSTEKIEIRGEIYCTQDSFIDLAKMMIDKKLERPNSLRNIVAGLLGRKDHSELCQFLNFSAFEILEKKPFKTEVEKMQRLEKLGFEIPNFHLCKKWSDVEKEIKECQNFFSEGDYLIDGLVFVYNQCAYSQELGETAHHPKHKIAFKFPGESKTTKIQELEWNVSRNGRCTPVAIVTPVDLSGALVSRVTLHHYGIVETFQLKKNDEIEIIRSGEVIPKFLRVVKSSKEKFHYPKNCPACDKKLIIDEHWLKCVNEICPSIVEQEILYYIKSVGIEEISEMRLREMMSKGLVKSIPDLYKIKKEDFLTLDKVKEKLAQKFYDQIEKAKKLDLVKFLLALGIEGFGESKIQKLIDHGIDSLEKFSNMKIESMLEIAGFAEKSSQTIVDGMKKRKSLIEKLIKAGVEILKPATLDKLSNKLVAKKFCITGTLSRPRDQIALLIKQHGGYIQDNVNKETNYLVTNDVESSSSKFVKAKKLGTKIISEDALNLLIK